MLLDWYSTASTWRMNDGSFPISPLVGTAGVPSASRSSAYPLGVASPRNVPGEIITPAIPDCTGRSTKDSHFVQEGYGLGTFHMTRIRPFAFYCVPNQYRTRSARHLLAQTHDDDPTLMLGMTSRSTKYTRRLHPVLKDADKQVPTAHPYSIPPTRRR